MNVGDDFNNMIALDARGKRTRKDNIYVENVDVAEQSENYIAKLIKYIKSNGLVYSLYDIENSALNKNYNERILQVLQLELELAVIQLVIQEKNYFVKNADRKWQRD